MNKAMKKKIFVSLLVLAMILQIGIGLPIIYAKTITSVGDFTITGGSLGTDYDYGNNTLTVKTSTPLTISGTTQRDNITVADGTEANITLQDITIDVSREYFISAFAILGDASCNLTIEGINSLKGGFQKAGLQVESKDGKTASAIVNGTGSLSAVGGEQGAGIGGGYGSSGGVITINDGTITATGGRYFGAGIGGSYRGNGGTITINGGTITAIGEDQGSGIGGSLYGDGGTITINDGVITAIGGERAAGIGGGLYGDGGAITINDGTIMATGGDYGAGIGGGLHANGGVTNINGGMITATGGNYGAGIGGGYSGGGGTFSTSVTGNAFIVTNSISDESDKENWKGVIFNGNDGKVYGDAITLTTSAKLPVTHTLTINNGQTLIIGEDATLTNKGIIVNNGTIRNGGIYQNDGGNLSGNAIITMNSSTTKVSLQPTTITYGKETTVTAQATITPTSATDVKGNVDFYLGDESSGIKLNKDPIVIDQDTQTATFNITNAILKTSGAKWLIGNNTITAVYHGTVDLKKSHGSGILTVNKASQADPKLTSTAETISGKADGKINGLTTTMEYSDTKAGTYKAVTDVNMNFASGTYYVRYQADTNHEPSDSIKITINKGKILHVVLPTNQEGYIVTVDKTEMNWNDEVTLTYMLKEGYQETADFSIMINGKPIRLDCGKYVFSKNEKDTIITVRGVENMYTYGILNGENSEWIVNSREGLTFRIDGDFTKLKGIQIDEKFVDSKYYEVKEGSTIITLKPEYLKMLSIGKHTMVVGYTHHEVPIDFTIRKVKSTTATGDENDRTNWILLLLASSAIIVFVVAKQVIKRRK